MTARLYDQAGSLLATLFTQTQLPGNRRFVFNAANVPDGRYRIALTAADTRGREVRGEVWIQVSRTLSGVAPVRPGVSPNGDGVQDTISFRLNLAVPAEVRLRILRAGKWVATPFTGLLDAGPHELVWDGRKRLGRPLDGRYLAEVRAVDPVGPTVQAVPFVLDTRAPVACASSRSAPSACAWTRPARSPCGPTAGCSGATATRPGVVAFAASPRRITVVAQDLVVGNRRGRRTALPRLTADPGVVVALQPLEARRRAARRGRRPSRGRERGRRQPRVPG